MRLATKLLLATCIPPFLIMGMGLQFGNMAETSPARRPGEVCLQRGARAL